MILIFVITFIVLYTIHFYWKVSKYPRGPIPFPIFGNTLQFDPAQMHHAFSKFAKNHGKIYTIWMFQKPTIVLSEYEIIKEALVNNGDALSDRPSDPPATVFQRSENGGIVFSNGDNWREQRRTAIHILRNFGVGKKVMESMIHEQMLQFVENVKKNCDYDAVDFKWPIQVMVANVINQLLYGFSYPHHSCQKLTAYVEIMNTIFEDSINSLWPILSARFPILLNIPYIKYKAVDTFHERMDKCFAHIEKDIATALEDYSSEDEPTCLVQAYKQEMQNNEMLTDAQLLNSCSDLFVAGMETTSTTLQWTVLYFAKYPEEQDKIRREIASVVGFDRLPQLDDRVKMPHTSAFIMELQRHSNMITIGVPRKSREDVTIQGHFIPAGTDFMPNIYESMKDPNVFEDPDRFNPARFLNPDEASINQEMASKVVIFGMGKRQCAGENLARTELFLFTIALVQKFRFFPPVNEPLNMDHTFGLTLQTKKNRLRIEEVDPSDYKN